MKENPQYKQGDYVFNHEQITPEIRGKVIYSFVHDYQQQRYYVLEGIEEPQHESKLSLSLSAEDLEDMRAAKRNKLK